MDGSQAGSGRTGAGARPGVIAAVVVLVSLLLIVLAVMIGIRLGGTSLAEQTATGPVMTSQKSTTTTTTRVTRTSRTSTAPTTTRRATAVCDARVINADLGYPGSGARIIDCGGGWAVMASEHSGDPFWVSFQGGRWQSERDVSIYLMTCPDEAIARGAPAWLADKHLTCETFSSPSRPTSSRPGPSRSSSRTTSPGTPTGTGASPTTQPTSPTPTGPSGSPSATTSAATSTTSSPSTDPTAQDAEDAEFAPAPAP